MVAPSLRLPQVNTTSCIDGAPNSGDTTWVLLSSLLILGMMPALAFFEAGMLRSKNSLSIISQVLTGITVLSVMWVVFGYSLVFGKSQGGLIGTLEHAFLNDVSYFDCSRHANTIPHALFALFELMFAAISPLLLTGAYAERMRWKAFLWLTIFWEIFVYYPLAHWVWGGGWLMKMGTLDFAGGIVIHASAGASSIVCALWLGRRKNFEKYHGVFPPSNLPLAAIGAALLWMGWFGFNGGSALVAGPEAVAAVLASQLACSSSSFIWMVLSWKYESKPSAVALMNGALAGLAGITPTAGYIAANYQSIILGFIMGVASFYFCMLIKDVAHIDDALDVSSVHGLTGVIGSLAVGFVAQAELAGVDGWFYGERSPKLLGYQTLGVVVAIVWAGGVTWIILACMDRVMGGVRVSDDAELVGLDWSAHREVAYHDLHVLESSLLRQRRPVNHNNNGDVRSPHHNRHDGGDGDGDHDGISDGNNTHDGAPNDLNTPLVSLVDEEGLIPPGSSRRHPVPDLPTTIAYRQKAPSPHTPTSSGGIGMPGHVPISHSTSSPSLSSSRSGHLAAGASQRAVAGAAAAATATAGGSGGPHDVHMAVEPL